MSEIKIDKEKLIPCVPTRDLVVFEDMTVNFEVARSFTISASRSQNAMRTGPWTGREKRGIEQAAGRRHQ